MPPVLCVGSRVLITINHAVKLGTSNGAETLEVNLNGRTGSISAIDDDRKTVRVDVDERPEVQKKKIRQKKLYKKRIRISSG